VTGEVTGMFKINVLYDKPPNGWAPRSPSSPCFRLESEPTFLHL